MTAKRITMEGKPVIVKAITLNEGTIIIKTVIICKITDVNIKMPC